MRLTFNFRYFKIYPKLVLTLLMSVLPIYAISLAMNESGALMVKNQIVQSMQSKQSFYLNWLETDLDHVSELEQQYFFDADIEQLSTIAPAMTNYDRAQAILRLENKLLLMENSSQYIENVSIYIPLINTMITPTTYLYPVGKTKMAQIIKMGESVPREISYQSGCYYIGEFYPYQLGDESAPNFILVIQLSKSSLDHSLSQITSGTSGGTFLFSDNSRWVLGSQSHTGIRHALDQTIKVRSSSIPYTTTAQLNHKAYFLMVHPSPFLKSVLVSYVPTQDVVGSLYKYRNWLWFLTGVSAVTIFIVSYWIHSFIHSPLKQLVHALRKVEHGDLTVSLQHDNHDEFNYVYQQFNAMTKRLNILVREVYEHQIRSQRAELKQLQAQIKPHFLYNSFFTLYRMAQMQDFDGVISLAKNLGDYLQFITRNARDDVALEQEFKHVSAYCAIQTVRFSKRITTHFDPLPANCGSVHVPRLILQPILENVYEHGLKDKLSDGLLKVGVVVKDHEVSITIEDNGDQLSHERLSELQRMLISREPGETTGILNVHRRLQLKFGEDYGLALSRSQMGGMQVGIRIPLG